MKVQAGKVDRFVDQPADGVASLLLYGPDQGLVGERAKRAMGRIVDDLGDPFRVVDFVADDLRSEPGRLIEEVQALSLMGGQRVVRVRQAGDGSTKMLTALFDVPQQEAFLVVEAGELPPSSSLRRLFEKSNRAAALPCYRDEGGSLADVIRSTLREAGFSVNGDALTYLQDHLGGDRQLTRNELDKLILYKGEDQNRSIRLDDVVDVIGDSSALMIDDLVWAILTGKHNQAETALTRLLAEGQAPVRIVRAIANTLMRLLPMRLDVESGKPATQVVAGARPPIHFRRKDVTRRVLDQGDSRKITRALAMALETERLCKTTGLPDHLMLQRFSGRLGAFLTNKAM